MENEDVINEYFEVIPLSKGVKNLGGGIKAYTYNRTECNDLLVGIYFDGMSDEEITKIVYKSIEDEADVSRCRNDRDLYTHIIRCIFLACYRSVKNGEVTVGIVRKHGALVRADADNNFSIIPLNLRVSSNEFLLKMKVLKRRTIVDTIANVISMVKMHK